MAEVAYGATQKITISLPVDLIRRLNDLVPPRKRSRFIAQALERELETEEFIKVIDETTGLWKDEDYPELATEEDIDRFIRELREGYRVPNEE